MVAQKITVCPCRGDDNGIQNNSNTKRHGFFANECQCTTSFETGRNRSFNVQKESTGERSNRSDYRRNFCGLLSSATGHRQLFRGKGVTRTDCLKPEPLNEQTMFHDSDGEFFQDLVQWCAMPDEEAPVQSIDPSKVTEERAHKTDTLHTPFSPQSWGLFDANSPAPAPQLDPISPTEGLAYDLLTAPAMSKLPFQEQFVDINELPVVIGDLASDVNTSPWDSWHYTYTKPTHDTMPFIQDESLDAKLVSVMPREVERNDVVVSEYILEEACAARAPLSVDVAQAQAQAHAWPAWPAPDLVSTPDVLSFVEQLETEKHILPTSTPLPAPVLPPYKESPKIEHSPTPSDFFNSPKSEPHEESEDERPKKPGRKRRHDSEDSDESYTPYREQTRKYRPRKPSVPIKDMIKALEGAQKDAPKSRRGRPPKAQRRDSTVSTLSNNSSLSTHEMKYRELRDKNNEASKRSRMNRKLKELQMEQMADELEERNNKLRVQADMLSERINELRKTFMLAVSQKKVG